MIRGEWKSQTNLGEMTISNLRSISSKKGTLDYVTRSTPSSDEARHETRERARDHEVIYGTLKRLPEGESWKDSNVTRDDVGLFGKRVSYEISLFVSPEGNQLQTLH